MSKLDAWRTARIEADKGRPKDFEFGKFHATFEDDGSLRLYEVTGTPGAISLGVGPISSSLRIPIVLEYSTVKLFLNWLKANAD